MAYTTPMTAVSNAAFTAAQFNASVRDDILVTPAALATSTGQLFVSTAANAIAVRVPTTALTALSESTGSASFVDLATVGPTVSSLQTGTSALFAVTAFIQNSTAGQGGYMGCAVSGASTIAASTVKAVRVISENAATNQRCSYFGMFSGSLTAGANTFTAKYQLVGSGTAGFDQRELTVIPL